MIYGAVIRTAVILRWFASAEHDAQTHALVALWSVGAHVCVCLAADELLSD